MSLSRQCVTASIRLGILATLGCWTAFACAAAVKPPVCTSALKPSPATGLPSAVLVEAAAASGGITLADHGHPDVSIPLHWVEKGGCTVNIRWTVTPLVNGRGNSVTPSLMNGTSPAAQTLRLDPHGLLALTLNARLPEAGNYRALLRTTLIVANKETELDPVPITIARVAGIPPVEFVASPQVEMTWPWSAPREFTSHTLAAYTTGGAFTLPMPHLVQATRKGNLDATLGTVTPMALSASAGTRTSTRIEPGHRVGLPLVFTDVPGAGRYDVTVRFASDGYRAQDATIVFLVREPAGVAFFCVFVGVLLSFLVQLWGTAIKPAREQRQRVARLLESVTATRKQAGESAAEADVKALFDGVETGLQQRVSAAWYRSPQTAAGLDVYDAIVPALRLWFSLWQQLDAVRPESVRGPHRQTLLSARAQFVKEPPDALQVQAQIQSLEQIPEKIRADVSAALNKAIGELDTSLAADPRAAFVALRTRLHLARARLATAQVEAAIGIYDEALASFAAEMTRTLRQRVDDTAPQPAGLEPAEWLALKKDTLDALGVIPTPDDAQGVLGPLRQATAVYVLGLAGYLRRAVANAPAEAQQWVEDAVSKVNDALDRADLVAAWAALGAVQRAYAKAMTDAAQQKGFEALGALLAATRPIAAPPSTTDVFGLPGWWANLTRPGAADRISRRTFRGDLAVSAAVLLVAGLGGVLTLWVPNLVWGGSSAHLAAFLLGFGADRVTQASASALRR